MISIHVQLKKQLTNHKITQDFETQNWIDY